MKKILSLCIMAISFAFAQTSNAQTTYTLGTDNCTHGSVNCFNVPIQETGTTVWIGLLPYTNPTSSRFILRIPDFPSESYAEVNLDSTYKVTYMPSVTFTARDGRVWVADGQTSIPGHTGKVPQSVTLTFTQLVVNPDGSTSVPPNPLTGEALIQLGGYYYVDQCSGRGCGGTLGWYWYVTGGTITVNGVSASNDAAVNSPIAPTPTSCPTCKSGDIVGGPIGNYGGEIIECGWTGSLPPYLPTGGVGANGVQVGASCYYFNTLTGTYSNAVWMTWWIPWSTWFFPPSQTPYCESSNYSTSTCSQNLNVNAVKQSTPQHPAL